MHCVRRYLCCGRLLSRLSLRRRLPNVIKLTRPLLANNLSNILPESAPLVAVLVPPSSSMAAVSKVLATKLPRKSDRSDTEVGERWQSRTLRFGKCAEKFSAHDFPLKSSSEMARPELTQANSFLAFSSTVPIQIVSFRV